MNTDVHQIRTEDYRYDLPDHRIAVHPLAARDSSKLLIYKEGNITSTHYSDLPAFLPSGTLLVMNDTKVVAARLLFEKNTGGVIEIFCLQPAGHQPVENGLTARGSVRWHCMVGGISKWKQPVLSKEIMVLGQNIQLKAMITERLADGFEIAFDWASDQISFDQILAAAGQIPLPPYLRRKAEDSDQQRYQTVYADKAGSVAAPTAGLHFTDRLLKALQEGGVEKATVTLHVGAGTFLPVKSETIAGHTMHREWIVIPLSFIKRWLAPSNRPVVAVGTTALRTLETLFWMGVKAKHHPSAALTDLEVTQWDPYQISAHDTGPEAALGALIQWMERKRMEELICTTQLLIAPGYQIKMADALITNFHQPASTLLLLVAACIGEDWRKVYRYALDHEYRFLSYGDGSLLWCGKG